MSPKEQDEHLANLLLDQRRTKRTLACLVSKARQTHQALNIVLEGLQDYKNRNVSGFKETYASVADTDIGQLISEIEKEKWKADTIRKEIEDIDGSFYPD